MLNKHIKTGANIINYGPVRHLNPYIENSPFIFAQILMLRVAIIKFMFKLYSMLPLGMNHVAGTAIGTIYNLLPSRQKHITAINLQLCFPQMPPQEREQLAHHSLIESAKTLTETGPMWYWERKKLLSLVHSAPGEDAFRQAVNSGKGVILAMPHLGCWELVNLYCSMHYPVTTLYRRPRIEGLNSYMCHSRQRFGATLVPTTTTGIRHLYKALAKGQLVSILPDQEPGEDNGIFAPFFGVPAYTMTLLSRLAHKYQAQVFYAYAQRLEGSQGYQLHFIEANKKVRDSVLSESVQSLNRGVEECILTVPQQYQWGYKRFKTRPEGESRYY